MPLEIEPQLSEVVYAHIPGFIFVKFDTDMAEVPINPANLFMRIGNLEIHLNYVQWMHSQSCKFARVGTSADFGINGISWIGGAVEFVSLDGIPLPVFTDYPVRLSP